MRYVATLVPVNDGTARILLVSGSSRGGSTNTGLLGQAAAAPPAGVEAALRGMTDLRTSTQTTTSIPAPAVAELEGGSTRPTRCSSARPSTRARFPGRSRTCLTGPSAGRRCTASRWRG